MDNEVVLLDNWYVAGSSQYDPPELQRVRLGGITYGHHAHSDGTSVITSEIASVNGKYVTTRSGTVYLLQDVCDGYRTWCREKLGKEIDINNPIKLIGGNASHSKQKVVAG